MEILISGHSGFVGQNLVYALSGNNLHVLSRKETSESSVFHSSTTWNTLSSESFKGIDAVVHLAGKAHDLKNTSTPEDYFKVNTGLTQQLFDLFLLSKAKDFIYFSSVKAAADTVEAVLNEEASPKPGTPYGQSKLKAEEYLLSKELPEGKRLFIVRPCMIHGPGNKGNLNLLYRVVKMRIPYPLAAFENRRSFLSIENLNFIIQRLLADRAIPGGIYNLADDEALPTTELIKVIGIAGGKNPRLWSFSPALIKKVAALGDKLALPLNSERLMKLTESYVVDNRKIKKALKITNLPVSTREGLVATIRSFEKQ